MVENIPSKDIAPPTTSQTTTNPFPKIQSYLKLENCGEEETRKKEQDAVEAKDTRVGPVEKAEMAVKVEIVVQTVIEEEETIHGENIKRVDEDHQGEAQQKIDRVELVVEAEVANPSSWARII